MVGVHMRAPTPERPNRIDLRARFVSDPSQTRIDLRALPSHDPCAFAPARPDPARLCACGWPAPGLRVCRDHDRSGEPACPPNPNAPRCLTTVCRRRPPPLASTSHISHARSAHTLRTHPESVPSRHGFAWRLQGTADPRDWAVPAH